MNLARRAACCRCWLRHRPGSTTMHTQQRIGRDKPSTFGAPQEAQVFGSSCEHACRPESVRPTRDTQPCVAGHLSTAASTTLQPWLYEEPTPRAGSATAWACDSIAGNACTTASARRKGHAPCKRRPSGGSSHKLARVTKDTTSWRKRDGATARAVGRPQCTQCGGPSCQPQCPTTARQVGRTRYCFCRARASTALAARRL